MRSQLDELKSQLAAHEEKLAATTVAIEETQAARAKFVFQETKPSVDQLAGFLGLPSFPAGSDLDPSDPLAAVTEKCNDLLAAPMGHVPQSDRRGPGHHGLG